MWLYCKRILNLLLVFYGICICIAIAEGNTSASFITACKTNSSDHMFKDGTILALVHEIGKTQTILYQVYEETIQPIAWHHYSTPKSDEFFEAQGGVRSTAIALDVFNTLRTNIFFLTQDWHSIVELNNQSLLHNCVIKYIHTERYDKSE